MFTRRSYLLDVTKGRVPTVRTFRLIVDWLARSRYTHFYVPGVEAVEEADRRKLAAYCQMQDVELVPAAPTDFSKITRVETFAGRSLTGRVEKMREDAEFAERFGRESGATEYLVTDWSDGVNVQPLVVSLPAIILGGGFAVSGASAAHMDLEKELNAALDVPLAGLVLKLGTLYLLGGAIRADSSELFNILTHDNGYSRHPNLTQQVLDDISGVAHGTRIAAERWTDRSDWAKEIAYMANLLECACHRRDEKRLRALRDEHGRVWRMRFVDDESRVDSLLQIPRF